MGSASTTDLNGEGQGSYPSQAEEPLLGVAPRPSGARFYLPSLDGVRAVAFLLTFWVHAGQPMKAEATGFVGHLDTALVTIGAYGVPLFFTMSAYLVTRLLLLERERTGAVDVRAFIVRRTVRIWPVYYAAVLIAAIALRTTTIFAPARTNLWVDLGYAVFMGDLVHAFAGGVGYSILWSLGVEEKFYLLWPWAVRKLSAERLRRLGWGLVALGIVSAFLIAPFGTDDMVARLPITNAAAFGYGIVMACGGLVVPRSLAARASGAWLTPAFLVALLVAVVAGAPFIALRPTYYLAVGGVLGPAVAAGYFAIAKEARSGFLTWRPMVEIGKRSYGAYVIHYALVLAATNLVANHRGAAYFGLSLGALALTLALAFLSYRYFETPFLRLKARFERVPSRPI